MYAPNRDAGRFFVTEILPRLGLVPRGLEFLVAGKDPGSDLEDLVRKEPRLRLLGFVPQPAATLQPSYGAAGYTMLSASVVILVRFLLLPMYGVFQLPPYSTLRVCWCSSRPQ